jgi:hypothetical protein
MGVEGKRKGSSYEICQASQSLRNPQRVEIKKRKVFDEMIERRHGTSINPPKPMNGESDTNEPDELTVTLNLNLRENSQISKTFWTPQERFSIDNRCGSQ